MFYSDIQDLTFVPPLKSIPVIFISKNRQVVFKGSLFSLWYETYEGRGLATISLEYSLLDFFYFAN